MASQSEIRVFVFAVSYIILFSAFISSMPTGLQGAESENEIFSPVDPEFIANFADSANYSQSDFTGVIPHYYYDMGGFTWESSYVSNFWFGQHELFFGLWLGGIDFCILTSVYDGATYGHYTDGPTLVDIENDSENGTAYYDMTLEESGNSAGRLIFHYNDTAYSNTTQAWAADALVILHGLGLEETATTNIMTLLLQILFLQLPEVPTLLNFILSTPMWAAIIYLLWFIIKETIPFV